MSQVPNDAKLRDILPLSLWFGLVAGLIEGLVFLLFLFLLQFEWVSRAILLPDVAVELIWISPLFNALLFGVIGLGLVALFRLAGGARWAPAVAFSVSLFSFLSFLDWLALLLSRRLHQLSLAVMAAGLAAVFTRFVRKREDRALRFWRRSLPWLAVAVALVFAGVESGLWLRERMAVAALTSAPPAAPNVLMIVVDTLRADHLSGYGYARPTSPRLDRLAQEGALFESAFSASSWTAPSHASLLTGRHPHEHGVEWQTPRAVREGRYPTWAEALKERGYRTAAFSANSFWFTRPMGFGRGFIRVEDFFESPSDMALRTFYGRAFEQVVLRRLGIEV